VVVAVPEAVRRALAEHSREEEPNEACGLVVLKDGIAERYERGRNAAASPYRFELDVDPELWFLEDDGYEGKPYLIYSLREDDLAAWTIQDGQIAALQLA